MDPTDSDPMEDDSLPLMFQTDMSDAPAELSLPKMLRELDLDVTCVPMNEARTRLYKILMKFIEDGDLDEDEWRTSDVRSIADYLGASASKRRIVFIVKKNIPNF